MVVAEILAAIGAELGGLLAAPSLMFFKLFCASETSNVANLYFLTCL